MCWQKIKLTLGMTFHQLLLEDRLNAKDKILKSHMFDSFKITVFAFSPFTHSLAV